MKTPTKKPYVEESYTSDPIDDIYESAFSPYGAKDADYDDIEFDSDDYADKAY